MAADMKPRGIHRPRPKHAAAAGLFGGVWLSLVGWAASGCGTNATSPLDEVGPAVSTQHETDASDMCLSPAEGCACTTAGATAPCGSVTNRSGAYVTCSMGTRTCSDGLWGSCVGAYMTSRFIPTRSDIRVASPIPAVACSGDPCDPTCTTFVETPTTIDAGADSGLTITDAAVTLTGVPASLTACNQLQITPSTDPAKDLTVTTMAPSPNTVSYTAALLPSGCYPGTLSALWAVDKYNLAEITSGVLTLAVPIAGPITVSAYAGTLQAAVVCNVTVNVVDTSAAPSGYSNTQFPTTTGAADNITIVYPYAATVFPLGLPPPLIQWTNNNSPATTASAVKVTLSFPTTGTPIFSWSEIVPELQTAPTPTLAGQPRATIPQSVWNAFQQTVVGNSGTTGGDANFAIQRYVSGTLHGQVSRTIHFANGQLKGNIFYNSYGTNLVQNFGSTPLGAAFGAATLEVPVNGTTPEVVVGYTDPTLSGAGCRVCHSAASGGTNLLSNSYLEYGTSGGGTESTSFLYNPQLATPALIQGSQTLIGAYGGDLFTYAALAPNGTYLFTSAAPLGGLVVANPPGQASALYSLSGTVIGSNVPSTLGGATPAFSTDAAHVAFTFYSGSATPLANLTADGRSIAMMDFAAPSTFSNFQVLYTPPLTTASYSDWPAFLPAGQNGIVFGNEITTNGRDWAGTRSTCDSSGSCNNIGATSNLWWVSTVKTGTPSAFQASPLTNLNGGTYLPTLAGGANYHGTQAQNGTYYEQVYNYEPTVLPVTIGGYSWVAFTSRRLYGNVATIDPYWSDPRYQDLSVQPTTKKIWIAAISPSPTPGTDPSFPAFYLPGQELLAGNSRAYFSLAACEQPGPLTSANLCTSNLDCCGATTTPATAVCQLDPPPLANPPTSHCVAVSTAACVANGANCTTAAQCCNFATGAVCASGTCQPTPPVDLYSSATFSATYTASCATGTYPSWEFLYWESVTPTGTSIVFTAETSTDGVHWGAAVNVGTSAPPPTATTTWTSGSQTVNQALVANGQTSQVYLQVFATLNPSSDHTQTPQLTNWQVQYDCVASE